MGVSPRICKHALILSGVLAFANGPALADGLSATATYSAAAVSSTPGLYDYNLTLNNTGTTDIGTFWFAWIPGGDFLDPAPVSLSSPAGWAGEALPSPAGTGTSIRWVDGADPLRAGESLSGFSFSSFETPDQLLGTVPSGTGAGDPILTSFVYIGEAFADPGEQFVPTAATPEPSSLVLLGSGLLGGAGVAYRRFKGQSSAASAA